MTVQYTLFFSISIELFLIWKTTQIPIGVSHGIKIIGQKNVIGMGLILSTNMNKNISKGL
jgi:hypothetical protein